MEAFKKNDRVLMVNDYMGSIYKGPVKGMLGTVKKKRVSASGMTQYLINFDISFKGGHTCKGVCEDGHGFYLRKRYISLHSTHNNNWLNRF